MKRVTPKSKTTARGRIKRIKAPEKEPPKLTLRAQMESLDRKYKSTRRQLKSTEREVAAYREALSIVLAWGNTVDERLNEIAAEIANLFKIHQIDGSVVYERPTLSSALGRLAELGALPIDANAVAIFRRPIP